MNDPTRLKHRDLIQWRQHPHRLVDAETDLAYAHRYNALTEFHHPLIAAILAHEDVTPGHSRYDPRHNGAI